MGLTKIEKEIYELFIGQNLSVKNIAIRRDRTKQAIYKILAKIKKKGFIFATENIGLNGGGHTKPPLYTPTNLVRLHFQHLHINPYFYKSQSRTYLERIKKGNLYKLDQASVYLYKKSIEVYDSTIFYGKDADNVTEQSLKHIWTLIAKIEQDFGVCIVKNRKANISIVRQHFAETNNEIAKDYERKNKKLGIKADEDGRLWLIVDNSENWHELETLHQDTAKQDNEAVLKHFNDIRNNNPPTLSQVMQIISDSIKVNQETAAGLNAVVKLINAGQHQIVEPTDLNGKIPDYIN